MSHSTPEEFVEAIRDGSAPVERLLFDIRHGTKTDRTGRIHFAGERRRCLTPIPIALVLGPDERYDDGER